MHKSLSQSCQVGRWWSVKGVPQRKSGVSCTSRACSQHPHTYTHADECVTFWMKFDSQFDSHCVARALQAPITATTTTTTFAYLNASCAPHTVDTESTAQCPLHSHYHIMYYCLVVLVLFLLLLLSLFRHSAAVRYLTWRFIVHIKLIIIAFKI